MSNIKELFRKFWFQHRDRTARILLIPMAAAIIIFMISSAYGCITEFVAGFSGAWEVAYWALRVYGTLITPLLAFRVWNEIFHDGATALSIHIQTPIGGGGII